MYLKNYKKNENPDVLKCLADLSNEEVFTSPNIAKKNYKPATKYYLE